MLHLRKSGLFIRLDKGKLVLIILLFVFQPLYTQEKVLRFEHFTVENGLPQNTVNGIVKDKYGFMWFGTWGGLCRYDGYKFTIYKTESGNLHSISHNRIHLIKKDIDGNIWILPYDTMTLCRYNYETDDFTRFSRNKLKKEFADSLSRTRDFSHTNAISNGYTWHVDKDNLQLTQTNNHTHKQITYIADPLNRWALSDGDATDVYIDDENILWVGTYSGGVNKALINSNNFSYYYHALNGLNCLINNNIRSIALDKHDILWVGTRSKGITKIDRRYNKYTHYTHDAINVNSLISNQIRKIFVDYYDDVWIGTKEGLDRYDTRKNVFHHYSTKLKNKIPHDWVYVIMEDNEHNLWIGTWNGFAKYNRKSDTFLWYNPKIFNLKKACVRDFIEDKERNFWLATEGEGLLNLKRNSTSGFEDNFKVIKHYQFSQNKYNSISDNLIYTLCEDENGNIWAGTNSGLDKIVPGSEKITHFTDKDGLPDITIMGILSDKKGKLWMSHKKGLSCINTKTKFIKNYSIQDGLQGIEFSENACFRNPQTGEMFFGGTNGLNSFFPDSIKDEAANLIKVVFTDLKIQNQSVHLNELYHGKIVLKHPLNLTSEITIRYEDKSFSIEFAGLHFDNPRGIRYKYILSDFDKDWITTDASKRFATYSNLNPGTYIFKVKASTSDNFKNQPSSILKIKVLPPWWKTLVFRILFLLTCVLIIFFFIYWRIASYRSKERELTFLIHQRTEELEKNNLQLLKEQILIEEQSETLRLANENLKDQQARLEEYSEETQTQNEKLKTVNEQLMDHQKRIEAQSEELRTHAENLKEANDLLIEKQKFIQLQAQRLEESNQQLALLNSTKDRFFSIIAHDLRNPFHSVSGLSEILLNDHTKFSSEKIERFLSLIHTSSVSGNNLLENLLQWSRSQTGRILFKPVSLNLADIIEENLNLMEGELVRKSIAIKSIVEADITVIADENMVNTIIRNLLSNAIKFTYEDGNICIYAANHQPFVEVTVKDSGIGITEKNKRLLFKIDTNVSTRGTSNETGTGLGLILCREFVEKHGGKIWVESEEGKGSAFKFTLPTSGLNG